MAVGHRSHSDTAFFRLLIKKLTTLSRLKSKKELEKVPQLEDTGKRTSSQLNDSMV
jgi:hypothetical protein